MSITPWREIAVPHQDVLKGTFQEPEFGVASINYQLSDLLSRATNPMKTI